MLSMEATSSCFKIHHSMSENAIATDTFFQFLEISWLWLWLWLWLRA